MRGSNIIDTHLLIKSVEKNRSYYIWVYKFYTKNDPVSFKINWNIMTLMWQ